MWTVPVPPWIKLVSITICKIFTKVWLVVSPRSYAVRYPPRVRQHCIMKSPLLRLYTCSDFSIICFGYWISNTEVRSMNFNFKTLNCDGKITYMENYIFLSRILWKNITYFAENLLLKNYVDLSCIQQNSNQRYCTVIKPPLYTAVTFMNFWRVSLLVFCPRAGLSLKTQEPRLQFCPKTGLPQQIQEPKLQFYYG